MPDNMQKKPKHKWYVGIDFGTTNTYVVAYDEEEDKMYTNESRLKDTSMQDQSGNIPTAITVDIEQGLDKKNAERVLVGNRAIQKPLLRIFRELKTVARTLTPPNGTFGEGEKVVGYPFRNCDLETSLQFGTDEYPIKKKVKDLLRVYFQQIFEVFGINPEDVDSLVVGCPAVNGKDGTVYNYKDVLQTTLQGILGKKVTKETVKILPEPELAGVTCLFGDDPNNNVTVLVIDIGGGTTDFSVLKYAKGTIKYGVKDSCNVAGNTIDDLIQSLLPDDFHTNKLSCRQAKEQCFSEEEGGNLGKYGEKELTLWYERREGEGDYISLEEGTLYLDGNLKKSGNGIEKQVFEKIGNKLDSVLDKHKGGPINRVFFVGGSSAIPQLIEYLKKKLTHSKQVDHKVGFETMFGQNQRTIAVPGGESITVTNYNAVAIGAFIQAATDYKCIVMPKITLAWPGVYKQCQSESTKNKLLFVGNKYVEAQYAVFEPNKEWFGLGEESLTKNNIISWTVEKGEEAVVYNYLIDINQLKKCTLSGERGTLIILSLNKESAECVVYGCKKPSQSSLGKYVEKNGIDKARWPESEPKAIEYKLEKI